MNATFSLTLSLSPLYFHHQGVAPGQVDLLFRHRVRRLQQQQQPDAQAEPGRTRFDNLKNDSFTISALAKQRKVKKVF